MLTTSSGDNWERLVAAVLKRDQIWQLCHQDSITTISSDFSQQIICSSSSTSLRPPSPQLPLTDDSAVGKNASGTITQKLFSALLWRRKRKDDCDFNEDCGQPTVRSYMAKRITLHKLLAATDHFSSKNIIGQGGHSTVYKGRLADGSLVAVKRSKQQVIGEELEITGSVSHRNVVRLRGFCTTQKEHLLLYPYMANGSVASCLRERNERQPPLEWRTRRMIACDVARGLVYLHHECSTGIIHRDIKAANILLDEDFVAVVADFTSAKFMDCNDDDGIVKGTHGHVAPEYLASGKCSQKSDVYGYGVFLLELITGKKSFDPARGEDMMLLDWVKKSWEEKSINVMVDGDLRGEFIGEDMEWLLQTALICTQTDPERRPLMPEVLKMLEGDGLTERWVNWDKELIVGNEFFR